MQIITTINPIFTIIGLGIATNCENTYGYDANNIILKQINITKFLNFCILFIVYLQHKHESQLLNYSINILIISQKYTEKKQVVTLKL